MSPKSILIGHTQYIGSFGSNSTGLSDSELVTFLSKAPDSLIEVLGHSQAALFKMPVMFFEN